MIKFNDSKLIAAIMLVIAVPGSSFINPAFATNARVNVDCKDLALALITWDQLIAISNDDDIAENEHELYEKNIKPSLYADIIDDHLTNLLEQVKIECNDLDNEVKDILDGINFTLPF